MLSWLRISGLIKILFLEIVAIFGFSFITETVLLGSGISGCSPNPVYRVGIGTAVMLVLALAATWWLLRGIFKPRTITQTYQPTLEAGPLIVQNPTIAPVDFPFATTSPWYVLIEMLGVGWAALFWNDYTIAEEGCTGLHDVVLSHAMLAIALAFPLLRLLAWYGLRLRTKPEAQAGAWKPVALIWGILTPFILFAGFYFTRMTIREHRLPVVDAQVLAGGLSAHPNLIGTYVRLRGSPKSPVIKCDCEPKDPNFCKNAAVLVDLGAGGEVVAHERASGGSALARRLRRGAFDEIGKLTAIPDPKADPYADVTCGFDRFGPPSPLGRAYLELGTPF